MNSRILFFLLITVLAQLISCGDDDHITQSIAIKGTWNLKNISGGLQGTNIDYKPGEVVWKFNGAGSLIVENNIMTIGPEDIYSGLESGTYPYVIQIIDNTQILYINNFKRGMLQITNKNLKIDDGVAADGFITEFEK